MIRPHKTPSFLLLFLAFSLWSGQAWSQPGGEINYRVVPNLEPMKDSSPTPDFTLPLLTEEKVPSGTSWLSRWWRSAPAGSSAEKVSLKDFRGKLVFLNFWASWCLPCREEMPAMERLYQEFKDKGFVIVAVNVKDKRKDALAFIKELKVTYPALYDPEGEVGLLYGAWGLPATYLIGREGVGLARMWGPAQWYSPEARDLIRKLLDAKK